MPQLLFLLKLTCDDQWRLIPVFLMIQRDTRVLTFVMDTTLLEI